MKKRETQPKPTAPDGRLRAKDLTRAQRQEFLELMQEKRLREQAAAAEHSLYEFVKMFWHVLEPDRPLIDGWALQAICDHLEAVTYGHITRLIINVPPGFSKSLLTDVFWPAWEWGPMKRPSRRYMAFSYNTGVTERDNGKFSRLIQSPLYQRFWGKDVTVDRDGLEIVSNTRTGQKMASSIGGSGTGHRADALIIDDPNNPYTVESDAVRNDTNRWLREVMPDRLNDMRTGAIILIQQRTHDEDATGTLLKYGQGYDHLCIRMRYDDRFPRIPTSIGWEDPRDYDGDLAWEERFPESVCRALEIEKGPFAWHCTPAESPVLMADLSLKPISEVQIGDRVIGFESRNLPTPKGGKSRKKLVITTVTDKHCSIRPVQKMTLDSGHVVRCTPDHKWYTARDDHSHKPYAPARIGRALMRICDPALPSLNTADQIHAAGWLSGFFDGEGSVSIMKRVGRDHMDSAVLTFTQSCERNLPVCTRLEENLSKLGLHYGVGQKTRVEGEQEQRMYWMKGDKMSIAQKFLHVLRVTKWRERIERSVLTARFIRGEERVVKIEADGEEPVYGLTTDTGNYVVWGLASSNSQYQQTPTPRGGGLIPREAWKLWPEPGYEARQIEPGIFEQQVMPEVSFVIMSVDTASSEKEENDPTAASVWGVWHDQKGRPKVILLNSWSGRLRINELTLKLIELGQQHGIDRMLIENKNNGISVYHEIQRLMWGQPFGIETFEPRRYGNKVARVLAVQPMFDQGMVYSPDTKWAAKMMDEVAAFPKGAHDDLVDTMSSALLWLRDSGVLMTAREYDQDVHGRNVFQSEPEPLYDI